MYKDELYFIAGSNFFRSREGIASMRRVVRNILK